MSKADYVRGQAACNTTFDHHCHWTGCTRKVPPAMWGCKQHWFKDHICIARAGHAAGSGSSDGSDTSGTEEEAAERIRRYLEDHTGFATRDSGGDMLAYYGQRWLSLSPIKIAQAALSTPAASDGSDTETSLEECPPGPFIFEGTLGLKTEYRDAVGNYPEAYCLESGEFFWGGTSNHEDRARIMVRSVAVVAETPSATAMAPSFMPTAEWWAIKRAASDWGVAPEKGSDGRVEGYRVTHKGTILGRLYTSEAQAEQAIDELRADAILSLSTGGER